MNGGIKMKKLLSCFMGILCLLVFSGPSSAAGFDLNNQGNQTIAAISLGSIIGDISPNADSLKAIFTDANMQAFFKGKRILIYEEDGVQLYMTVVVEKLQPKVKLIVALKDKAIQEGSTNTISGILVFNVGYNILKQQVTLGLDTDGYVLLIKSDSKTTAIGLKDVTIGIGTGTLNQGQMAVTGTIIINGFPVDIGSLSKMIELISKTI